MDVKNTELATLIAEAEKEAGVKPVEDEEVEDSSTLNDEENGDSSTPDDEESDVNGEEYEEVPEPTTGEENNDNEMSTEKEDVDTEKTIKKNGVTKRIDEITREKYKIKSELDGTKQELEKLKQEFEKLKQDKTAQSVDLSKPKLSVFRAKYPDDPERADEEYAEAIAEYKIEEKEKVREAIRTRKEFEGKITKAMTDFKASDKEVKKLYPDFDDVYSFDFVSPIITQIILEEKSHLLAYKLMKDPELLAKLNSLPSNKVFFEVGKLVSKYSLPVEKKKVSQAPKPIPMVGKNGKSGIKESDLSVEQLVEREKAKRAANK